MSSPVRRIFAAWACMLAVCLNLGGCSKEEPGLLTREQMWVWVGQHVQVGMPLEAASETLQNAGFECQRFKKTAAKIIDINKTATEGTYDFLRGEAPSGCATGMCIRTGRGTQSPPVRNAFDFQRTVGRAEEARPCRCTTSSCALISYPLFVLTGVFSLRRGRLPAAHGHAMGLVRDKQ
jgi:hypothetical protein